MGTTFRVLAVGTDMDLVLRWFDELPTEKRQVTTPQGGLALWFPSFGALIPQSHDSAAIDPTKSPVVTIFPACKRRGALWTAAEIHFLATPVNRVPELQAISRRFRRWLGEHEVVWSGRSSGVQAWDYFLEGSIRDFDGDVFALPAAIEALRGAQYFVAGRDTDGTLDRVCKALRLRGVEGIDDT